MITPAVAEAHPRFLRKALNEVVGAMLSVARADALEAATRSLVCMCVCVCVCVNNMMMLLTAVCGSGRCLDGCHVLPGVYVCECPCVCVCVCVLCVCVCVWLCY